MNPPIRLGQRGHLDAILFDLDGTLAHTAHDLAAAANVVRLNYGLAERPLDWILPFVTAGSVSMTAAALSELTEKLDDGALETARQTFLQAYEQAPNRHTRLFHEMERVLTALDERGIRWGIVTNKQTRFTVQVIQALGLDSRAACVVSGDSTPYFKPHPAPLFLAAETLRCAPAACAFVGDAVTDIEAGREAGMFTIAAHYGYIRREDDPLQWGADWSIESPAELLALLEH